MRLSYNSGVDSWKEMERIVSWNFSVPFNPETLESPVRYPVFSLTGIAHLS